MITGSSHQVVKIIYIYVCLGFCTFDCSVLSSYTYDENTHQSTFSSKGQSFLQVPTGQTRK